MEVLGWKLPAKEVELGTEDPWRGLDATVVSPSDYFVAEAQRVLEMLERGMKDRPSVWTNLVASSPGVFPTWDWCGDGRGWVRRMAPVSLPDAMEV